VKQKSFEKALNKKRKTRNKIRWKNCAQIFAIDKLFQHFEGVEQGAFIEARCHKYHSFN
jgi:hypothetical protein